MFHLSRFLSSITCDPKIINRMLPQKRLLLFLGLLALRMGANHDFPWRHRMGRFCEVKPKNVYLVTFSKDPH